MIVTSLCTERFNHLCQAGAVRSLHEAKNSARISLLIVIHRSNYYSSRENNRHRNPCFGSGGPPRILVGWHCHLHPLFARWLTPIRRSGALIHLVLRGLCAHAPTCGAPPLKPALYVAAHPPCPGPGCVDLRLESLGPLAVPPPAGAGP